MLLKRWDK